MIYSDGIAINKVSLLEGIKRKPHVIPFDDVTSVKLGRIDTTEVKQSYIVIGYLDHEKNKTRRIWEIRDNIDANAAIQILRKMIPGKVT